MKCTESQGVHTDMCRSSHVSGMMCMVAHTRRFGADAACVAGPHGQCTYMHAHIYTGYCTYIHRLLHTYTQVTAHIYIGYCTHGR